ncbi:ABC transporter permease [Priestia endophytica]|uniref:ABC transporter permease n=1 Tax=Priestia endophytica TaxID=135735 RepID=UPI002041FFE5|nr:ABC transporter permease [Priestia endophytica]MCM3538775.1 ABC transporter permease [Priestia endophytica]
MKEIGWIIKNIIKSLLNMKGGLLLYLFIPLAGIILSTVMHGSDNPNIRIGVVDEDKSGLTEDTFSFLKGLENTSVEKNSIKQQEESLTAGEKDLIVIFKSGFEESVKRGKPEGIELVSLKGEEATAFVKSYLASYIDNVASIARGTEGNEEFQLVYNRYQNSEVRVTAAALENTSQYKQMTYSSIGFLIVIMLSFAMSLSLLILKEKETRTYYRITAAPITARQYVAANIIVNMMVMSLQVMLTLTVMKAVFHIDYGMSSWQLFSLMFLFSFVSVGLSLVLISFVNSTSAAPALQNAVLIPTCMLSGCFWPIEVMPDSIQKIADFLPQKWVLETITEFQEGKGLEDLYMNFIVLFSFGIAFFLIAIYKFSRNKSVRTFV